ncbi:hypothetical protein JRQ81_002713 [Phrynocephalus forsythii]|uniref:Rho GTPase-activating protein SYDE1 n=1 Tax=Phrynocephalus forsythii TaxID=171643 RepID=A0A9Q0XJ54_9SAUR|nr:hypothetical protein JRQ81_002713 [Phrynocephalus forsythii]
MAQPLLRKTFSRLRGKERLGRKKGAQRHEPDPLLESTVASAKRLEQEQVGPLLPPEEDGCSRKGATITVSRKQNWAKFTWGSQEDSCHRRLCQRSFSTPSDPAQRNEASSPQSFLGAALESSVPDEAAEWPASCPEISSPSVSMKHSSQGAYLQSLERSSRHWVLSSGKTQGPEESVPTTGSGPERKEIEMHCSSKGEIWYNPIPEDENLQLPCIRRQDQKRRPPKDIKAAQEVVHLGDSPQARSSGLRTSASRVRPAKLVEDISRPQLQTSGKVQAVGMDLEEKTADTLSTAQSPAACKKGPNLSKAKSPGPVRSLSMKMKKLPELGRKLSLRGSRPRGPEAEGGSSPKESGNVISRYHLDSSVASWQPLLRGKAASKGGYLSDGDSPELQAKTEACLGLDPGSFRPYSLADQTGCLQHLSGLVSVHLLGVQDFRPPKAEMKEAFCVLQIDSVNKARTALLPCQASFLNLNHSFQLEFENAQLLKVVVFSCDPMVGKNRVCCHGTIVLPNIFQAGCTTQQLAMQLEPQGLLYIKLNLVDQWDRVSSEQEPQVFGVNLSQLVEREDATIRVPQLIQKCVAQIEKRGLKVVGLYRLCGSAAVKKELRDAFERDSAAVELSEDLYPDINVITGILKDYLRELPTPLITDALYRVVLEAMSSQTVGQEAKEAKTTAALLDCLPEAEKATLTMLLDHLSLVAAFHTYNRMNAQNLAVCFGPVLLSQGSGPQSSSQQHRPMTSTMDFKHHIEVLHYLLQAWPAPRRMIDEDDAPPGVQAHRPSCPPLDLPFFQGHVVARSRPRGLESPPSNRYAGDWSVCGQQFLAGPRPGGDTDYDEVAGSESNDEKEETGEAALREGLNGHSQTAFMSDFALAEDPEAPFSPRLNLKDFDALILDLERELSKQINVCM